MDGHDRAFILEPGRGALAHHAVCPRFHTRQQSAGFPRQAIAQARFAVVPTVQTQIPDARDFNPLAHISLIPPAYDPYAEAPVLTEPGDGAPHGTAQANLFRTGSEGGQRAVEIKKQSHAGSAADLLGDLAPASKQVPRLASHHTLEAACSNSCTSIAGVRISQ